ncbi:MAG: SDR family oxidoreductase [Candidatus Thermoplasmatota archaeon]|jgi:3-oxoacyl-[acyl-carrier protein] reductase|nr:SDR family oxidoreductase [Candidatus Thermoplasmatota archaeon]
MLNKKIVFVSGGSGYLGSAICERCANYGAKVYFSYYKNKEKAETLMRRIEGSKGIKINNKDVRDIEEKIEQLHKEIDRVDVLVNNAGVSQIMPFPMLEEDDVDFMMDVNIKGTIFLTKSITKRMIWQKKGSIVNIGSIAGHRMLDVPVHYATTKAAIAGFTYSLAAQLKRYGIRVNSVVPGLLEEGVSRGVPKELLEDYLNHCSAGRPGTGREVAEVVCFLASDRASYINGQNIFVDGGI